MSEAYTPTHLEIQMQALALGLVLAFLGLAALAVAFLTELPDRCAARLTHALHPRSDSRYPMMPPARIVFVTVTRC